MSAHCNRQVIACTLVFGVAAESVFNAGLDIFEEVVAGCRVRQDARQLAKAGSLRALVSLLGFRVDQLLQTH